MIANYLPDVVNVALNNVNINSINEIRMRVGKPIVVSVKGKNFYLSNTGISADYSCALICEKEYIDEILQQASNNSLYTINDQIINGYITLNGGIRIGVTGEVVVVNDKIKTIKNIRSLNIRIPHDIKNCSLNLYNLLTCNGKVKNTLIISPPGAGKTTFLRDFAYQLGKRENQLNLLIVDERNEISGTNSYNGLDVGDYTDIYTNCTKSFAFENGIRSMKPDVILTDEINLNSDISAIEYAISSGVNIVASIHANNVNDLKLKKNFATILQNKMFERYVVLSQTQGPGTIEGVFNEHLVCIYC